jgi:hypothetical protein
MKMYEEPPSELVERIDRMRFENQALLNLHQYRAAKAGFEQT